MNAADPVRRLLGVPHDADPFALLDLPREPVSRETVLDALRRRQQRAAAAPGVDEAEFAEAAQALHVAALRLLDPEHRDRALAREPDRAGNGAPAAPQRPAAAPPSPPGLRRDVEAMLVRAGGWNHRARKEAIRLAARRHVDARTLLRAIAEVGEARRVAFAPPQPAAPITREGASPAPRRIAPAAGPAPDETPPDRPWPELAAAALAVTLTVAALAMLWIDSSSAPTPVASGSGAPTARSDAPSDAPAPESGARTAAPAPAIVDDPIRGLARALELVETSPGDAAWRFEEAINALSRAWTPLDDADIDEARSRAIRFLASVPPGGAASTRARRALLTPLDAATDGPSSPEEALALAWGAMLASEAARDPSVPEATRDALRAAVEDALDDDEAAGFGASIVALRRAASNTPPLAGEPADGPVVPVWEAWADALARAGERSDALGRRAQTAALEVADRLVVADPRPSRRASTAEALRQALRAARPADAADWQTGEARGRLIAWIEDRRIADEDLAVALDIARDAWGLNPAVALNPGGAPDQRAALAQELSRLWGFEPPGGNRGFDRDWRREAIRRVTLAHSDPTAVRALEETLAAARLNLAAALRWEGRDDEAALTLGALDERTRPPSTDIGRWGDWPSTDGQWTVGYESTRSNIAAQVDALETLARRSRIGPIDAGVLVREALLGTPNEVRTLARRQVEDRADEPVVLESLLQMLPFAPRTPAVSETVEILADASLPPVRDEAWPVAARAALLDRALRMLPFTGPQEAIDTLAADLAETLARRAGTSGAVADPAEAARLLAESWADRARRLGAGAVAEAAEVESRRIGRRRVADGPIQRAFAEHAAAVEFMAAATRAEFPSDADNVRAAMRRFERASRAAPDALEQLRAAELAALRLWAVRLGAPLPTEPAPEEEQG